jgi:hypothetical protein
MCGHHHLTTQHNNINPKQAGRDNHPHQTHTLAETLGLKKQETLYAWRFGVDCKPNHIMAEANQPNGEEIPTLAGDAVLFGSAPMPAGQYASSSSPLLCSFSVFAACCVYKTAN